MKKEFKLLPKITFVFIVFAFIAFYSSAVFLTNEADEFIYENLDSRFQKFEHSIKHDLDRGGSIEKLRNYIKIDSVNKSVDLTKYPVFSDTTIYDDELESDRSYKKKTIIIESKNQYYRVELIRLVDDFMRLREDIFESLIPAFIILAVTFVLFAYLLSGYYFRPFNKILQAMKTYKVGEPKNISKVKTNTAEFVKMQNLYHEMIDRIEDDYQRLKEYTEHMAHEIQTPLTIIRNKTENLIADEDLMDKHSETVKTIYNQTNHLSKLGSTLNLLTKIENNEFNKSENLQTKPAIEKFISAVEELVKLKDLKIAGNLNPGHSFFIDPILFDVIIRNLINNSINYSHPGSEIVITTNDDSLQISNYGDPLPFEEDKLFERFQSNGKTSNSLGLGLALIKKICELNQLKIEYSYSGGMHNFKISN
ncbi:MAG: HAMP domain-containing histidine kinase [Melioribacteraceae bacterium]|nr:HAMP domain-containing histidine kinase [Melioribacteraceae bacterium]MCF8355046.1 HAMP domain-containing histidine kinase [Melioribacteraceae bacterium]MCF8396407.1 HAMP domain-containing histidine kinase [Melioribacteraceae bacterium]MCF8417747.1 HAMP domain-containing histidine kinase [Melioribacteraceae bacterium]